MSDSVTGKPIKGMEIESKRFGIHGVGVESDCPSCGHHHKKDLGGGSVLAYPNVGVPYDLHFYCGEGDCDTEWKVPIVVNISVSLAGRNSMHSLFSEVLRIEGAITGRTDDIITEKEAVSELYQACQDFIKQIEP